MAKRLKASSIATKVERRATDCTVPVGTRRTVWLLKLQILHKMAAPWPCDCFIQNQKNDRASGDRLEYPTI
jgi:hypothetical protein